MKKVLLGAVAAGMMLAGAPMAHATSTSTITGGCFFDTNSQATATNGAYVGVIGDRSVTQDAAGNPVSATVSCWITVNTVTQGSTVHSYGDVEPGVQLGADQIAFTAADGSTVKLCQQVVGSGFDGVAVCFDSTHVRIPPKEVSDAIDNVFTQLQGVFDIVTQAEITYIDPILCSILKMAPGVYGPFTIESDGDLTWVDPTNNGLDVIWDCPPYRPAP